MKIKTQDAIGIQLDWLVAKCEGYIDDWNSWLHEATVKDVAESGNYHPSIDWSTGGPILEREKLHVTWSPLWEQWIALIPTNSALGITGPTPLVAAMRAYATSKLGDEVEVPDELSAI